MDVQTILKYGRGVPHAVSVDTSRLVRSTKRFRFLRQTYQRSSTTALQKHQCSRNWCTAFHLVNSWQFIRAVKWFTLLYPTNDLSMTARSELEWHNNLNHEHRPSIFALLTTGAETPYAPPYARLTPASSAEDRTMNAWKHSSESARRQSSTNAWRLEALDTI